MVRRLELRVEPDNPATEDDFDVVVLVEGQDILVDQERFRPFDPWDLLGPDATLLPPQAIPRVATARCGCGNGGCSALAPVILERDGEMVWTDFRSVTGSYDAPIADSEPDLDWSAAIDLPELTFDADQYRAEVTRASADHSWETPLRTTSRLFVEYLNEQSDRLAQIGWRLRPRSGPWSRPFWLGDRLHVVLQDVTDPEGPQWPREVSLQLEAGGGSSAEEAASMVEFVLHTPPERWSRDVEGE
jgi:hypothetical protein